RRGASTARSSSCRRGLSPRGRTATEPTLPAEEPEEQRQQERQHEARHDREGEGPVLAPNDDVARQTPEVAGDGRPQKAEGENHAPEHEKQRADRALDRIGHPCDYLVLLTGPSIGRFPPSGNPVTEPSSPRILRLCDLPSDERPRERLQRLGPSSLSNEELLALLLRTGLPGESVLDRARRILAEKGGLAGLSGASPQELSAERGTGPARAATIVAAVEIARRLPAETLAGRDLLNEPRLVKDYLRHSQADDAQERTGALFLNARNRLLRNDPDIYRGTLDRAIVEPREILRRALLTKAAGVILYHNHPSGDPAPSREDREFTRRLAAASEAVGVRLLDHIVVGREGCVSFREAGLM